MINGSNGNGHAGASNGHGHDAPDGWDFNDAAMQRQRLEFEGKRFRPRSPQGRRSADWDALVQPLRAVRFAEYLHRPIPERQWIIPGWLPIGKVSGLYGPDGSGKTLLAQMLMTTTATEKSWLGLPTLRCPSMGLLCEDDEDDVLIRQAAINAHYGVGMGDLADMLVLPALGDDNHLMTFDPGGRPVLTPRFHQIFACARDIEAKLVVLDTAADVFGGNWNDSGQVRCFVQHGCGQFARNLNAAVVLLAHPSRSGRKNGEGDGGSVQWSATFRSRLYLSAPDPEDGEEADRDARILTRPKSNYAPRGEKIPLRWDNGVFTATAPPSGVFAWIEKNKAQRIFLELLHQVAGEGQYVSHHSRAGNYAPKIFVRRGGREDVTLAQFEVAMQALIASGKILIRSYRNNARHEADCLLPAP